MTDRERIAELEAALATLAGALATHSRILEEILEACPAVKEHVVSTLRADAEHAEHADRARREAH